MDLAYLPPLPVGLVSAAARDLALRARQYIAAAQLRMPGRAAAAVLAAVLAAWLINSMDWGLGEAGFAVAVCLGSLVATAALAAGWTSEPEELERWLLRAVAAALVSIAPALCALP